MKNIKTICVLGVLSALYVVLTAFCRVPIYGNIQLDLGYVAFGVALYVYGIYGTPVGVIGCALESVMFSPWGFSISWCVANLVIGVIVGSVCRKHKSLIVIIGIGIIATLLGIGVVKTGIELYLYKMPFATKLPKAISSFAVDSITLCLGLFIANKYNLDRQKEGDPI